MKISEKKIIHHNAQVIFEWINDIDSYQSEIPWCVASGILKHEPPMHMRGFLEMKIGPFRRKIITDNTLQPYEKISMKLVEGPFSHFEGYWELYSLGAQMTEVTLFIDVRWSENWLESVAELSYRQLRPQAFYYLEQGLLRRSRKRV